MLIAGLFFAAVSAVSTPIDDSISIVADHANVELVAVLNDEDHGKKKGRKKRWTKKGKKKKGGSRPVPEPMTLSLLGLGGAGLAYSARRRRRKSIDTV